MTRGEFSLNIVELAAEHFDLPNRAVHYDVVKNSIEFASFAVHRYQELEQRAIAELMAERDSDEEEEEDEDDQGPSVLTAKELCQVVELHRSLRGGHSSAGDLYHAFMYLLHRDNQEVDWDLVMQELSELIPEEEEHE